MTDRERDRPGPPRQAFLDATRSLPAAHVVVSFAVAAVLGFALVTLVAGATDGGAGTPSRPLVAVGSAPPDETVTPEPTVEAKRGVDRPSDRALGQVTMLPLRYDGGFRDGDVAAAARALAAGKAGGVVLFPGAVEDRGPASGRSAVTRVLADLRAAAPSDAPRPLIVLALERFGPADCPASAFGLRKKTQDDLESGQFASIARRVKDYRANAMLGLSIKDRGTPGGGCLELGGADRTRLGRSFLRQRVALIGQGITATPSAGDGRRIDAMEGILRFGTFSRESEPTTDAVQAARDRFESLVLLGPDVAYDSVGRAIDREERRGRTTAALRAGLDLVLSSKRETRDIRTYYGPAFDTGDPNLQLGKQLIQSCTRVVRAKNKVFGTRVAAEDYCVR